MIDLDLVVGFEWDDGNWRKSADKHDVTPAEAEQVFFNRPLLLLDDPAHSLAESRHWALGQTDDGRLLFIVFTIRQNGTKLRVISARDMHRKERARYASET